MKRSSSINVTPYNTGQVGATPEDISVQLQADLAKLESAMVFFLERELVNSDSPTAWVIVEHLHRLDAMSKPKLVDSVIKAFWEFQPEAKDEFSMQCRKRARSNIQRMLELRNILSHCEYATIKNDVVIAKHAPKAGKTETQIEIRELERFVGNPFLDIIDDLKYLFAMIAMRNWDTKS